MTTKNDAPAKTQQEAEATAYTEGAPSPKTAKISSRAAQRRYLKSWRNFGLFALIVAALGFYVYFVEIKGAREEKQREETEKKALVLDWDKVTKVELAYPEETIVLEKRKGEKEHWVLTAPIETDADKFAVRGIIDAVKNLSISRVVEENPADPAIFGLKEPYPIKVTFHLEDGTSGALIVGDKSPVGNTVYLQRGGEKRVLLAPAHIQTSLKKTAFDLREKKLLAFSRDDLRKIELTYPDRGITLVKKDDAWRIETPIDKPASTSEVNRLISTLQGLRATAFETEKAEDLSKYGLDKPAVTVTIHIATGDDVAQQTLLLGAEKDTSGIYAKRADKDPIAVVRKGAKQDLTKEVFDLRNKDVVAIKRWEIKDVEIARGDQTIRMRKPAEGGGDWTDPASGKKLKYAEVSKVLNAVANFDVIRFVDEETDDLSRFGLAEPEVRVTLSNGKEGEEEKRDTLLVGAVDTEAQGRYVKSATSDQIYLVKDFTLPASIDELLAEPKKPEGESSEAKGKTPPSTAKGEGKAAQAASPAKHP